MFALIYSNKHAEVRDMIKQDNGNKSPPQGFVELEEGLYEPVDLKDTSTDTEIDDYKDMMLEMHRFVNRQKSS